LLPRGKRATARKTWELIDLKLGAFVRGQLLLMLLVGTVLSLAFWAIGLPYWLLVGAVAIAASGVVFGGLAVLLAVPVAAVLVTLLDVVVLKKDPGTEDVPSVIFPAKDAQA
jgi:predicted PurR-regulated permease PerM